MTHTTIPKHTHRALSRHLRKQGFALLGRGGFSTAYHKPDASTVRLYSLDPCKEALALLGYGESELWPRLVRECHEDFEGIQAYTMPRYTSLWGRKTALCPTDRAYSSWLERNRGCSLNCRRLDPRIEACPYPVLQNALRGALYSLGNYFERVLLDSAVTNLAISGDRLILRDIFAS
jgi:hypothetical protein